MSAISTGRPKILSAETYENSVIIKLDRGRLENNAAKMIRVWLFAQKMLQDKHGEPTVKLERVDSDNKLMKICPTNEKMDAEELICIIGKIMQEQYK